MAGYRYLMDHIFSERSGEGAKIKATVTGETLLELLTASKRLVAACSSGGLALTGIPIIQEFCSSCSVYHLADMHAVTQMVAAILTDTPTPAGAN